MTRTNLSVLHCQVVEEGVELTLGELCQACGIDPDFVQQLVAHGVLDPRGDAPHAWVFVGPSLRRTRVAVRLMRDLDLNLPGAALAIDLLDEIARLRRSLNEAPGGLRGG